jgi:hypothetical protein
MVPLIKLKLSSLYLLDSGCISFLPLMDLYKLIDSGFYSAKFNEFTLKEIVIWHHDQIVFYWHEDVNVLVNDQQLKAIDSRKLTVNNELKKIIIEDSQLLSKSSSISKYTIKNVDFINDKSFIAKLDILNLINPLVSISSYMNNSGYKKDLSIWLLDKTTGQPLGIGLARYDRLTSEGVIDYIDIMNQDVELKFYIMDTLLLRLKQYTDFISYVEKGLLSSPSIEGQKHCSFYSLDIKRND